jgi:hypothetical protein
MIANQYAKDLPAVRVTTVDPSYTATDLNGHRGTQTLTEAPTRSSPQHPPTPSPQHPPTPSPDPRSTDSA